MRKILTFKKISFIVCLALVVFGCDACKRKIKADSEVTVKETTGEILPPVSNIQEDAEDTEIQTGVPEMLMVYVEGGSFQMGKKLGEYPGEDKEHVHRVTLNSFYIGKYEVTQGQYKAVMGALPDRLKSAYPDVEGYNYPVFLVNWYDAVEFCNKLSELEGLTPYYMINKEQDDPNNTYTYTAFDGDDDPIKWHVIPNPAANGYCLPTEAQWEYAAKGGNTGEEFSFAGSDDPDEVAWYYDNSNDHIHEVGLKKPNGLDIYDMTGNVEEWCWDWNDYSYPDTAETDPLGSVSGHSRILRSGSYYDDHRYIKSNYRSGCAPHWKVNPTIGFRVARNAQYDE
jgi:formylglycine-generating enzyme required for sulfatase activity